MSCGIGRNQDWDPELLWLWCRLTATVPIQPLGWEPPYATGSALKRQKKKKKKKKGEAFLPLWDGGELQAFPSSSGVPSFCCWQALSYSAGEKDWDAQGHNSSNSSTAPWPCDLAFPWIHFLDLEKMRTSQCSGLRTNYPCLQAELTTAVTLGGVS